MFKKNVVFQFFCSFRLHIFIVKNLTHTFLSGTLLVKLFFSNHHFQYFQIWLFRAHFQKECGFWVDSGLISSKTTFFLGILLVRWFSQITFSNHHFWIWLFGADFQKECVFWVDSGLISTKTTFLLGILLVKIVFSNHFHKSLFIYFQIWLIRADFQKECVFCVDSGLISSKTTFLLRILLVKVVFSKHQRADYADL